MIKVFAREKTLFSLALHVSERMNEPDSAFLRGLLKGFSVRICSAIGI